VVAYNSDNAEMSRRQSRSSKAVKYGNVSEEEAWKFVTLNPAKLHILTIKLASQLVKMPIGFMDTNPLPLLC
jgi:hypothetical protein